ncbi:hypothetical protein KBX06_23440 [Micromonospora sp. C31]|uniref:hypothetical protein n=1 Tax=Micromonospora sp. C31 TaxID=2824876 RepID=UPI001B38AE40|nr:hypothetical protein [Micromonospora sp. C31]MBQ1076088.1 hypothetical protein [Micromonospora sp. C31]
MRRTLLPVAALALAAALSGCVTINAPADDPDPAASGQPTASSTVVDDEPADRDPAPSAAPDTPGAPATLRALTCEQLKTAALGNGSERYNGYAEPIPLVDGMWSGEDGTVVHMQQPCAVGDLTGDEAADALVPVLMDGGGTGKFWQVVMYGNIDGQPHYVTMIDIGDRTPVESVSISSRRATVVYLTRPEDASSAEVAVRRTAVYRLSGSRLVEVSHTDTPYTP